MNKSIEKRKKKMEKVRPWLIVTKGGLFKKKWYMYFDTKNYCIDPELESREVKVKFQEEYASEDDESIRVCFLSCKKRDEAIVEEALDALGERMKKIIPDFWERWEQILTGLGMEARREAEGLYIVDEEEALDIKKE